MSICYEGLHGSSIEEIVVRQGREAEVPHLSLQMLSHDFYGPCSI